MKPSAALALIIIATLTLTACETIPRPFRHEGDGFGALARPKLERGIALHPAADLEHQDSLAQAVIKAFAEREIPVTLRQGPGFGRVIDVSRDGNGLIWRLIGADGGEISRLATTAASTDGAAKQVALTVVAGLSPLLDDPDSQPRRPAGMAAPNLPRVRVQALKGLPGDGDSALTLALIQALGRQRIDVTETAPYTVVGVISVAQAGATEDNVTISWLVKQGDAGGTQLARIDQSGAVPRGRLNLTWGSLARDIAEGGASGVADVVRQAERQREDQKAQARSTQFTDAGTADIGKLNSSDTGKATRTEPPAPSESAPSTAAVSSEAPSAVSPAPEKPKPAMVVEAKAHKAAAKSKKTKPRAKTHRTHEPATVETPKPASRTTPDR